MNQTIQQIHLPETAGMKTDVLLKHLSIVNKIFTEQVKTADQKAAYIFSFLTAILIFWSADLKRGFSLIMSTHTPSLIWILTLLFLAALFFTIITATLIVTPRVRPSTASLFWGAWPAAGERLEQHRQDVTELVIAEYMQNVAALASICQSKFRYVSYAQIGLVAMITFHVLILAFDSRPPR